MKQSRGLKLIIVHYHWRPGGVRRVLELAVPAIMQRMGGEAAAVVLATGEAPDAVWLASFQRRLAPVPVEVLTQPAFGYFSEQRARPAVVRRKIHRALRALFGEAEASDTMVWAHNLGLGRNLLLTAELFRLCAVRRIPLLAHHHDWWFENRWQRWPELRRCGFRTLKSVAEVVLPATGAMVHATINREDARVLEKHFPGRVQWLPNPAALAPAPPVVRLRFARRWLRETLGRAAPLWLLPCRLLRRKNIAEALLLTRWLRPGAWLVTTGGVSSDDEKAAAAKLAHAARLHGWPLRLGILAGAEGNIPTVAELMAASEAVLLTSIQEGFGLPNLEAAASGRPLIARRLPNIAPDLEEFGFRFPQCYDEIMVAPELFDWSGEVRRQRALFRVWSGRLPRTCRAWAGQPAMLASEAPESVAFSRLTLTAQLEVLRHAAEESWPLCAPFNSFLQTWKKRAAAGRLQVTPWPRTAAKWLSGPAYAAQFEEIIRRAPIVADRAGESVAAQKEFIRTRLDSAHRFPLLWTTCS